MAPVFCHSNLLPRLHMHSFLHTAFFIRACKQQLWTRTGKQDLCATSCVRPGVTECVRTEDFLYVYCVSEDTGLE